MKSLSGSQGPERTNPLIERDVIVSAPCRLHFGLLSIGRDLPVNFGGAGLMLQTPRTQIRIGYSDSFSVAGADFSRIERIVNRWQSAMGVSDRELSAIGIDISDSSPRHFGLGSGTTMALGIASALCRYFDLGNPAPGELAMLMGRGRRSSIGTYGFFQGGFLVDRGREPGDSISPLDLRLDFPAGWPVVLILPCLVPGNHGAAELESFDQAAIGDPEMRQQMTSLLNQSIVPSISNRDFRVFSNALHEFNVLGGNYYQTVQRGTWHSPEVAEIVEYIRELGVPGIIQSSWGPGLAAFTDSMTAARSLAKCLCELGHPALAGNRVRITHADNDGAVAGFFHDDRVVGNQSISQKQSGNS